jgi:hypothetical protein
MNRTRLEKMEQKIEKEIDILTDPNLSREEKKEQIAISNAIFKGVSVIVSAEAVVEKYRATKNDMRETDRLIKKYKTDMEDDNNE